MNLINRELRDLAHVPRWGIVRLIRQQSVAEHSFYVACYAYQINGELNLDINEALLMRAALLHDVDEQFMSDIPGPAKRNVINKEKYDRYVSYETKRRFGTFRIDVPEQVKKVIKLADLIDETMFLAGEIQMGNGALNEVFKASQDRMFIALSNLKVWPGDEEKKNEFRLKLLDAVYTEMNGQSLTPSNNEDVE